MNLEELEKLNELKKNGVITEEEFLQQKKKLLDYEYNKETDVSNKNEVGGKDNVVINNNVTVDTRKKGRKIGILTILGYIVGIPVILSSMVEIFSGNIVYGIFSLLAGMVIVPIFNDLLEKKFNFKLSSALRIVLFIIFVSIAIAMIPDKKDDSLEVESLGNLSSVENKITPKEIELNNKITSDNWEIVLLDAYIKDSWKIPNSNSYLSSSFKSDEGKTYIVSKIQVKNLGAERANFGDYSFITDSCESEAICNENYKYSMLFRGENDTFYTGYISVEPLETEIAYIYKEVPNEAVTNSVKIKFNILGTEYIYTLK